MEANHHSMQFMEANHRSMTMHGTLTATPTPTGFRFVPTEKEILVDYLLNKVSKQPLPSDVIKEIDLYGDEKIWQRLFEESGESFVYFFTKLKKKTECGSRIERVSGFGCWRGQKDTKILYRKKHIGSKRTFSYSGKGKRGSLRAEGRWTMTEYRLDGCLLEHVKNNDYVVCLIKKLKKKGADEGIHIIDSPVSEHYSRKTNSFQQIQQARVPEGCSMSSQLNQMQICSVEPEASTLIDFGSSVAGANSTYIDCPPAYYSSSQQELQMAPTEPNNATSTLEAQAQGQMDCPPAYHSSSQQELQMTPTEPNNATSTFEAQAQGQIDCPPAYYSSSQVQEVQMVPTEHNTATSSLEAQAQGQMMEYSGSNSVVMDDLGFFAYQQVYGDGSFSQEVQMTLESDAVFASTEVSFENQGQINECTCSAYITGDDSSSAPEQTGITHPQGDVPPLMFDSSESNQYSFMSEIQWEVDRLMGKLNFTSCLEEF